MSHQFAGKDIKEVFANGDGEGGDDGFSRGGNENKPDAPPSGLCCPRCSSTNSKFCYFNNGKTSQPRYYCRDCKRYWTHGGSLRNIPIGGGCRKRGRHSSEASTSASVIVMRPLASLSLEQRIRLVMSVLAAAFITAVNNNDGMSDQMQQMPSQPTLPATNMQYFGANSGSLLRNRVNQSCYSNRVQMYNYYASVQQQQQQQQLMRSGLLQQPNNQPMQQLPQQQIHPRPLYQFNQPMQANLRPVHQHIQPVQQLYQHPMQQPNQRPFQQSNQYPFQQPNQAMQQLQMHALQQSNLRLFQQVHQHAVQQPNLRPLQQSNQPMVEHHVMQQRPIAPAPQNEHQLFNYPNAVVRESSIILDDWTIIDTPPAELLVDNNTCTSTSNNLNQEDNNHLADKLGTSRFDDQTGSS